jgi:hypothetical protein
LLNIIKTNQLGGFRICLTGFCTEIYRFLNLRQTPSFYRTNAGSHFRICLPGFFTEFLRRLSSNKTTAFYTTNQAYYISSNPPVAPFLGTKNYKLFDFYGFTKRISLKIWGCFWDYGN